MVINQVGVGGAGPEGMATRRDGGLFGRKIERMISKLGGSNHLHLGWMDGTIIAFTHSSFLALINLPYLPLAVVECPWNDPAATRGDEKSGVPWRFNQGWRLAKHAGVNHPALIRQWFLRPSLIDNKKVPSSFHPAIPHHEFIPKQEHTFPSKQSSKMTARAPKTFNAEEADNLEDVGIFISLRNSNKPPFSSANPTFFHLTDREAIRSQGCPTHDDLLVHSRKSARLNSATDQAGRRYL